MKFLAYWNTLEYESSKQIEKFRYIIRELHYFRQFYYRVLWAIFFLKDRVLEISTELYYCVPLTVATEP